MVPGTSLKYCLVEKNVLCSAKRSPCCMVSQTPFLTTRNMFLGEDFITEETGSATLRACAVRIKGVVKSTFCPDLMSSSPCEGIITVRFMSKIIAVILLPDKRCMAGELSTEHI